MFEKPTVTLSKKFTRDAKFTPAELSAEQLDQVERIVKASISQRSLFSHVEKMTSPDDEPVFWLTRRMNPVEAAPFWGGVDYTAEVELLKTREDARRYFKMCWNYLVAIAWRNGEFLQPHTATNRTWAMASGYHG